MIRKVFICAALAGLLSISALAANILVLNLDRNNTNTGPNPKSSTTVIRTLLTSMGYQYDYLEVELNDHTTLATLNFNQYQLLVIGVGTNCLFQAAHQFDNNEGNHLVSYLNAGGKVYMEGNDVWYQDPHAYGAFDFKTAFQVNPTSDGGLADMWRIRGITGSPVSGLMLYFDPAGDNCFVDIIDKISGVGTKWFENEKNNPPDYTRQSMWISYNSGTYKTIASCFEFGGLFDWDEDSSVDPGGLNDGNPNNTKAYVWGKVMDFFGVTPDPGYGDLDDDGDVDASDLLLLADYLAGNINSFSVATTRADLDTSGTVNVKDLTILLNYIKGHITSLPFTG
jgi:hypothetical protein